METGLTKNRILTELAKSTHGKLEEYVSIGTQATKQEPEFMAHLISWNRLKGQIRDSQVALPVVSLAVPGFHPDLAENSQAHLALLGPREFLKAAHFVLDLRDKKFPVRPTAMQKLAKSYLHDKETNTPKWDRIAILHRKVLRNLYSLMHVKPANERTNIVLYGKTFDNKKAPLPEGSIFQVVSRLKDMDPVEAAGVIIARGIPPIVAQGALGKKAKDPDVVLALISRMSPTELVTNTKMLEKLGMKTNSALRGAYEKALEKTSKSNKNILKTSRAAEAIEDEELKEKLRGVQERQIKAHSGIDGNWLVLGDRSPSMEKSVEVAKHVAATLAKMVKGKVWLIFFDSYPQTLDVTGMAFDEIVRKTKHISAGGSGTSIGCGLQRMLETKEEIDGIAIVTDGGQNISPRFSDVYQRYSEVFDKQVPVYMYQFEGDTPHLIREMESANLDMQVFDLRNQKVDYYSLPNLVATMRTNRYSLVDEVMSTKLLKLSDVFKSEQAAVAAEF